MNNQKKEQVIEQMSPEEVLNELKEKRLPTYGTAQERRDRLKKQYGIMPSKTKAAQIPGGPGVHSGSMVETGATSTTPVN